MKQSTIQKLKAYGFENKYYEEQGLSFYHIKITSLPALNTLVNEFYDIEEDDEIDLSDAQFVMEIQTNGLTPQWVFTGSLEKHDFLNDEEEFLKFVDEIMEKITKKEISKMKKYAVAVGNYENIEIKIVEAEDELRAIIYAMDDHELLDNMQYTDVEEAKQYYFDGDMLVSAPVDITK
ncbi:hypothetical protein P8825_14880 [Shouchella clausii]|uniref:hypothetical protein n=1 Tax=Shouchella clausii TaxID=79880 RepID=UPI002DB97D8A|nr:hypothetical protein [Shouchella clausii]MEB5480848.1 hypothetical protein [Shouchella clausii]